MTADERARFIKAFLDRYCFDVLRTKGREYSRGEEDVNSNFKRVAVAVGSDQETVVFVYLMKHIDSIAHFVKTRTTPSGESIFDRIGDAVNYLLILASVIEEDKVSEGS